MHKLSSRVLLLVFALVALYNNVASAKQSSRQKDDSNPVVGIISDLKDYVDTGSKNSTILQEHPLEEDVKAANDKALAAHLKSLEQQSANVTAQYYNVKAYIQSADQHLKSKVLKLYLTENATFHHLLNQKVDEIAHRYKDWNEHGVRERIKESLVDNLRDLNKKILNDLEHSEQQLTEETKYRHQRLQDILDQSADTFNDQLNVHEAQVRGKLNDMQLDLSGKLQKEADQLMEKFTSIWKGDINILQSNATELLNLEHLSEEKLFGTAHNMTQKLDQAVDDEVRQEAGNATQAVDVDQQKMESQIQEIDAKSKHVMDLLSHTNFTEKAEADPKAQKIEFGVKDLDQKSHTVKSHEDAVDQKEERVKGQLDEAVTKVNKLQAEANVVMTRIDSMETKITAEEANTEQGYRDEQEKLEGQTQVLDSSKRKVEGEVTQVEDRDEQTITKGQNELQQALDNVQHEAETAEAEVDSVAASETSDKAQSAKDEAIQLDARLEGYLGALRELQTQGEDLKSQDEQKIAALEQDTRSAIDELKQNVTAAVHEKRQHMTNEVNAFKANVTQTVRDLLQVVRQEYDRIKRAVRNNAVKRGQAVLAFSKQIKHLEDLEVKRRDDGYRIANNLKKDIKELSEKADGAHRFMQSDDVIKSQEDREKAVSEKLTALAAEPAAQRLAPRVDALHGSAQEYATSADMNHYIKGLKYLLHVLDQKTSIEEVNKLNDRLASLEQLTDRKATESSAEQLNARAKVTETNERATLSEPIAKDYVSSVDAIVRLTRAKALLADLTEQAKRLMEIAEVMKSKAGATLTPLIKGRLADLQKELDQKASTEDVRPLMKQLDEFAMEPGSDYVTVAQLRQVITKMINDKSQETMDFVRSMSAKIQEFVQMAEKHRSEWWGEINSANTANDKSLDVIRQQYDTIVHKLEDRVEKSRVRELEQEIPNFVSNLDFYPTKHDEREADDERTNAAHAIRQQYLQGHRSTELPH